MLLKLEKISKSFSAVPVLQNVDFELKQGEVHVLAGENGAGKSTLIKIIAGAYLDFRGRIFLDGRPVRCRSPREASSLGIAVIHQEMSLIPSMSVVDNIFLGREKTRRGGWMDHAGQRRQAAELLSDLGITADLEKCVAGFPLALQQMVEVAKAIAIRARVVIMDEPTSALDETETSRLFRIVTQLKEKGCGIIFISHRLDEIYRLADRITVLRDGISQGTYTAAELPPASLIRLMVGREITQQFPERHAAIEDEILGVDGFFVPDPTAAKRWAVQNVTFQLRRGEILGVAGLQGSGKSELLQGLFGAFAHAVRGRVRLAGEPYRISNPRHAVDSGLALLTSDRQATGLVPQLSVTANITLASIQRFSPRFWMQWKKERDEAHHQVEALAIRPAVVENEVGTLSGGNQQKVILARWLQVRPRVFLLDEPTRGVDVAAKHDIYELLSRLIDRGEGIVWTTSELPELLALSDRILVLHRGVVTAELARGEFSQERVVRAALGERCPA